MGPVTATVIEWWRGGRWRHQIVVYCDLMIHPDIGPDMIQPDIIQQYHKVSCCKAYLYGMTHRSGGATFFFHFERFY